VVMGISDQVTVLDHGEKISEGTAERVRSDPRVIEAYLGRGAAGEEGRGDRPPDADDGDATPAADAEPDHEARP
jgi:ABC-type glutathione transport system ATPase component